MGAARQRLRKNVIRRKPRKVLGVNINSAISTELSGNFFAKFILTFDIFYF